VDEGEDCNHSDSDSDGEHIEPGATTAATAATVNSLSTTASPSVVQYTVAKKAPFHQINVERIISDFGATDFLDALSTFLRKRLPTCKISPHVFDRFDVYKQIIIHLPYNRYLSNHPRSDRLRTSPAVAKLGRKAGTSARFDTALLVENWDDHLKFGGLEGSIFSFF
jgi:hypothetical protein